MTDWVTNLKAEIRDRAEQWAAKTSLPSYKSRGNPPTILFKKTANDSRHGNFFDPIWKNIKSKNLWCERLQKPHSQRNSLPERYRSEAKELDSSNSSDALLMNCFCYPGAANRIATSLGLSFADCLPEFGYKPRLPLTRGRVDSTEIDMRFGGTLFEAKLTEKDFTSKPESDVKRYRHLEECFDPELLPRASDRSTLLGYQLIRNVLAAAKDNVRLIVLIDGRRPDLLQQWWKVHGAIRSGELRNRCEAHFWQEVAAACASPQRKFLEEKYGL